MTYNERIMLGNVEKERDKALNTIDYMVDVIGKHLGINIKEEYFNAQKI